MNAFVKHALIANGHITSGHAMYAHIFQGGSMLMKMMKETTNEDYITKL